MIEVFVHPVDDPAIIIGDFNQSILEDGTALGDLNATDIDGLTDGSYYSISGDQLYLSMVTPRSIPSTETGATSPTLISSVMITLPSHLPMT